MRVQWELKVFQVFPSRKRSGSCPVQKSSANVLRSVSSAIAISMHLSISQTLHFQKNIPGSLQGISSVLFACLPWKVGSRAGTRSHFRLSSSRREKLPML